MCSNNNNTEHFIYIVPEPPLVDVPILMNECDPNGIIIEWEASHSKPVICQCLCYWCPNL